MSHRVKKRLLVALMSMAAPVVGWELYLRWFDPVRFVAPPSEAGQRDWTRLVYQPSTIDGLNYELGPDRDLPVGSIRVKTNSVGMRDDELREPSDSLVRIAVVGDSYVFGYGVEMEDTFCHQLEALLNLDAELTSDGSVFEVVNLGVGGYTTRDEALVVEHRALPLNPALIIVAYVLNDPETEAIQPLHTYFSETRWWQYSHILRRFAHRAHRAKVERLGGGNYTRSLYGEPEKWQTVVDGFADMVTLAEAASIPIGLVVFPDATRCRSWETYGLEDIHARVMDAANEAGFTVTRDLLEIFQPYDPLEVRVALVDEHPNPFGHRLTAEYLLELVRTQLP